MAPIDVLKNFTEIKIVRTDSYRQTLSIFYGQQTMTGILAFVRDLKKIYITQKILKILQNPGTNEMKHLKQVLYMVHFNWSNEYISGSPWLIQMIQISKFKEFYE